MSSHHIIRDQQEPALLISSLDGFSDSILHSLLEWSPSVFCVDEVLDTYLSKGHKVDFALVGEAQFSHWEKVLEEQFPVEIIQSEDSNFLESALVILNRDGHKALNLICSDHELKEIVSALEVHVDTFDFVIFTPTCKAIVQKHIDYRKWVQASTHLIVKTLGDCHHIEYSGFDGNHQIASDTVKLERFDEGLIAISCSNLPYLIIEDW